MNIKEFSERDICTKTIMPALAQAGWEQHQFPEEVNLTKGRVIVRGKLAYWPIYDLDIKNPNTPGVETHDPDVLLAKYKAVVAEIENTTAQLKAELQKALIR